MLDNRERIKKAYEEENREEMFKTKCNMQTSKINNLFAFCNKKDSEEYKEHGGGCEVKLLNDHTPQKPWKLAIVWEVDEPRLYWNDLEYVFIRKDQKDTLVSGELFKKHLKKYLTYISGGDVKLFKITKKSIKGASKQFNKLFSLATEEQEKSWFDKKDKNIDNLKVSKDRIDEYPLSVIVDF
jgi:hypothetical protein